MGKTDSQVIVTINSTFEDAQIIDETLLYREPVSVTKLSPRHVPGTPSPPESALTPGNEFISERTQLLEMQICQRSASVSICSSPTLTRLSASLLKASIQGQASEPSLSSSFRYPYNTSSAFYPPKEYGTVLSDPPSYPAASRRTNVTGTAANVRSAGSLPDRRAIRYFTHLERMRQQNEAKEKRRRAHEARMEEQAQQKMRRRLQHELKMRRQKYGF
ncbi:hypothetical protein EDD11_006409 [Mortierella claussenii]|nr:hypothetical protein EDD11_006409 [Mortierella claussenii]